MWADVRCAPSFTQHSYVCLRFYKRHVVWPLCVCVYGSWPAGRQAGWLAGRLADRLAVMGCAKEMCGRNANSG